MLFGPGSQLQREIVVREIAACAEAIPPLDAVLRGLQAAAEEIEESRSLRELLTDALLFLKNVVNQTDGQGTGSPGQNR